MAEKQVRITGKTYDLRDRLKAWGGIWEPATKSWIMDREQWELLLSRHGSGINKRDREESALLHGCEVAEVLAP